MKTQMTITVPTEKAGEQAVFIIEFAKGKFNRVMEMIELLVKPSDVVLAEKLGEWKIIYK
ncbi:hypothetical protein KAR91_10010 [Candidatus Pacearchaeota archaeon]|nr:hypothetical protein [Candidatus Pacearchaeota archaeon]